MLEHLFFHINRIKLQIEVWFTGITEQALA
jgi:hypothetical protein